MGSTSDDPVNGTVLSSATDVFVLHLPVIVGEEVLVDDGIHINVSWGFDGGSYEVGFMSFGVGGEGTEQFLGLVKGFLDGNGLLGPVDRGIDVFQPRES